MADELDIDFGTEELNDPNYGMEVTGDATDTTTPVDGQQQAPAEAAPTAPVADGAAPVEGGTGTPAPADAQQPKAPVGADGKPADAVPGKTDAKGNIVDAAGNIVAAAGSERRHYERAQKQDKYIGTLEKDLKEARDGASMTGVLNDVPAKLGLNAQDTEMGLQAIASFKKDPVATARWMLQETMRLGYTVNQVLGENAEGKVDGGSLDLAAVKAMISEQVAPLLGDRNAVQQQTANDATAQREYDGFMAKHENAHIHEGTLTRLLAGNSTLTPEVAYWQLREYSAKNGLDFNLPLGPQMQAKQSAQPGQQPAPAPNGNVPPQAQLQSPPPQAMPHGSSPASTPMTQEPEMASPDTNWDTIVQQSLREAGMNM